MLKSNAAELEDAEIDGFVAAERLVRSRRDNVSISRSMQTPDVSPAQRRARGLTWTGLIVNAVGSGRTNQYCSTPSRKSHLVSGFPFVARILFERGRSRTSANVLSGPGRPLPASVGGLALTRLMPKHSPRPGCVLPDPRQVVDHRARVETDT